MSKPKKQPKPEAGDAKAAKALETTPAAPKSPRLSPSLKAQADRMIAARDRKKVPTPRGARPPKVKEAQPEEDLVVFAFRLSTEERELIHKAAGPAKASRFVRALAVAAAKRDETALRHMLEAVN